MAATQHQLLGQVQNQQQPFTTWGEGPCLDDIPTLEGTVKLNKILQRAHAIARGGSSIGANLEGTDPGAGGGGNATVVAQHADRNIAAYHYMLSTISPTSAL